MLALLLFFKYVIATCVHWTFWDFDRVGKSHSPAWVFSAGWSSDGLLHLWGNMEAV